EERGTLHCEKGPDPLAAPENGMPHRRAERGVVRGQEVGEGLLDPRGCGAQRAVETLVGSDHAAAQTRSMGLVVPLPSAPSVIWATRASASSSFFWQCARSAAPRP